MFVHVFNTHKFDPCAIKYIFTSYLVTKKGYKCFHLSSDRFYISKDVMFYERLNYYSKQQVTSSTITREVNQQYTKRHFIYLTTPNKTLHKYT